MNKETSGKFKENSDFDEHTCVGREGGAGGEEMG